MILNGKNLKKLPFTDSRGKSGASGTLYIAEDPQGRKYLVKSKPVDVANEYVAHNLAKLIGVPTSDAVLIKDGNSVHIGIEYESDFQRVSGDDFLGTEVYEKSDVPFYVNGNIHKPSIITEAKYPDDDPLLGEFMAYLAFRNLIVLEDNFQLAFAGGRLISFDYAESFFMEEGAFNGLLNGRGLSNAVERFSIHLFLKNGYRNALEVLHRPDTDFLCDAFIAPLYAFQEADLQPIYNDLDEVFPSMVSTFYANCFEIARKEIEKLWK